MGSLQELFALLENVLQEQIMLTRHVQRSVDQGTSDEVEASGVFARREREREDLEMSRGSVTLQRRREE